MHRRAPIVEIPARLPVVILLLCAAFASGRPAGGQPYVPGRHPDWEHRTPEQVGFDPARLRAAIEFSIASEARTPRDLAEAHHQTFSVTKSFVSTVAGLAFDRGLIRSVDDPVRPYFAPVVLDDGDGEPGDQQGRRPKLLFESEHNRTITWDHLLRQTSDWEGTLWGKPEWADPPTGDPSTWATRWIDNAALDAFIGKVLDALEGAAR